MANCLWMLFGMQKIVLISVIRAEEFGDNYVIFMMHRPLVIVRSQEAVKTVLVTGERTLFEMTHIFPFRYMFGDR